MKAAMIEQLEESQFDLCGSYDLFAVYAANSGRGRFESFLFSSSDKIIFDFCCEVFDWGLLNFSSKELEMLNGGHQEWFAVLMSVKRLGVERYHSLGTEERKELFDLDPTAIDELGEFKVDELLWEGAELVEVLLAERGDSEDIQLLMKKMVDECVWADLHKEEEGGDQVEAWEGRLIINSELNKNKYELFVVLVDFLRVHGLLRKDCTHGEILFDDEIFEQFVNGAKSLDDKDKLLYKKGRIEEVMKGHLEDLFGVLRKIRRKMDVGEGLSGKEIEKQAVPNEPLSEVVAYDSLSEMGRKRLFAGIRKRRSTWGAWLDDSWGSYSLWSGKDHARRAARVVAVPEYEVDGFPEPLSPEKEFVLESYHFENLGGPYTVIFDELMEKFAPKSSWFDDSVEIPDVIFSPNIRKSFQAEVLEALDKEGGSSHGGRIGCLEEFGADVIEEMLARIEAIGNFSIGVCNISYPQRWLSLTVEQIKFVDEVFTEDSLRKALDTVGLQAFRVDSLEEMKAVRDLARELSEKLRPKSFKVADFAARIEASNCRARQEWIPKWIQGLMLRFEWGRKLLIPNDSSSDDDSEEGSEDDSYHSFYSGE
jgi:hypothetical protein